MDALPGSALLFRVGLASDIINKRYIMTYKIGHSSTGLSLFNHLLNFSSSSTGLHLAPHLFLNVEEVTVVPYRNWLTVVHPFVTGS